MQFIKKSNFSILSQKKNKTFPIILFQIGCLLSLQAHALDKDSSIANAVSSWRVNVSSGYTVYQDMERGDGQTAVGRLALEKDFFYYRSASFGIEGGVQSGNRMRLSVPQEQLDILGGLPIQTTIKPMLDLLGTIRFMSLGNSPIVAELKGGFAYRQLQIDRTTVNDKSQIAGEVQAGLGYPISEKTTLNLFYQGVFGSDANFLVNPVTETAIISNIPVQHGVLLGVSIII